MMISYQDVVASQDGSSVLSPEEMELRSKVKNRIYPGGRDEELLKVQSQLPSPVRRMAPTTEIATEPTDPSTVEPHD